MIVMGAEICCIFCRQARRSTGTRCQAHFGGMVMQLWQMQAVKLQITTEDDTVPKLLNVHIVVVMKHDHILFLN